jgi:hypothetical protein
MKNTLLTLLTVLLLNTSLNAQVFPVYFADYFKEDDKTILHFEWRPDYLSYKKAIIMDKHNSIVGEIDYPNNHFILNNSKRYKSLFITSVNRVGEKSKPIRVTLDTDYSALHESGSPEKIIIKKPVGENAKFVYAHSGEEFIAKGVNFCGIRLADHDTFEPDITATQVHVDRVKRINSNPAKALVHDVRLGDPIRFYDAYRSETLMRRLKEKGYNLIRVFVKSGERNSHITNIRGMSGPKDTKGISAPYMDNFIDFLTRAQKYGIYVMPCFTDGEMMDNDYFKALAKGATKQGILFSEDGIKAKQHFIELFLQYIKKKDPELINSLLALTMQNEFYFHSYEAPFNQHSGTYTFMDGSTYNMADDEERRALANAAIQNYYAKMKEAVEVNAPGLPVGEGTFSMGAVGKTYENSKGVKTIEGVKDRRFPMTAVELLNTDMDFLDFHVYRWGAKGGGKEVFMHFAENMHLTTEEGQELMKRKPIIMGEFGSFNFDETTLDEAIIEGQELMKRKPIIMGEFGSFNFDETTLDEAIIFVKELNNAALEFGFKGSAYWTVDTFEQTFIWNMMWENGKMLNAMYKDQ